jgi:hypothetical protein
MLRKLIVLVAGVAAAAALLAGPATAAPTAPTINPSAGQCVAAGVRVLQENGGISYFARNGVPLSLIGGEGTLPLSTVIWLHITNPELFPWCSA